MTKISTVYSTSNNVTWIDILSTLDELLKSNIKPTVLYFSPQLGIKFGFYGPTGGNLFLGNNTNYELTVMIDPYLELDSYRFGFDLDDNKQETNMDLRIDLNPAPTHKEQVETLKTLILKLIGDTRSYEVRASLFKALDAVYNLDSQLVTYNDEHLNWFIGDRRNK